MRVLTSARMGSSPHVSEGHVSHDCRRLPRTNKATVMGGGTSAGGIETVMGGEDAVKTPREQQRATISGQRHAELRRVKVSPVDWLGRAIHGHEAKWLPRQLHVDA